MAAGTAHLPVDAFPMPEIDANGVDRSQIRRLLDLAPAERLEQLETFLATVIRIRDGSQPAQVPRDPSPAR